MTMIMLPDSVPKTQDSGLRTREGSGPAVPFIVVYYRDYSPRRGGRPAKTEFRSEALFSSAFHFPLSTAHTLLPDRLSGHQSPAETLLLTRRWLTN
jgi:hypothetical protein